MNKDEAVAELGVRCRRSERPRPASWHATTCHRTRPRRRRPGVVRRHSARLASDHQGGRLVFRPPRIHPPRRDPSRRSRDRHAQRLFRHRRRNRRGPWRPRREVHGRRPVGPVQPARPQASLPRRGRRRNGPLRHHRKLNRRRASAGPPTPASSSPTAPTRSCTEISAPRTASTSPSSARPSMRGRAFWRWHSGWN